MKRCKHENAEHLMNGDSVVDQEGDAMTLDLDKLRALADAATRGPWTLDVDRNDQQTVHGPGHEWIALLPHQCVRSIELERAHDAAFIAAAREAVPALLALVESLIADRKKLNAALLDACGWWMAHLGLDDAADERARIAELRKLAGGEP